MESRASLKFVRMAPRKARLVADLVRGKDVSKALDLLQFAEKRSAPIVSALIRSAMANASSKDAGVDADRLYVKTITVDQGPTLRRWTPRAMGRATRINKKTSHIVVVLDEHRA
ncbi:50S ribosomal protein L22 [Myxococcota bacterium]|nr:50S ribosomal protein L22 [Myxococcota bacterium]